MMQFAVSLHVPHTMMQAVPHILIYMGFMILAAVNLTLLFLVYNFIRSPLKSFPGPFGTKFTNFWRLLDVAQGRTHLTQIELHRKYGPAVRIGPNLLSLSDPTLMRKVYNTGNPWKKSRMYQVQESSDRNGKGLPNLFSTADEQWHTTVLRPIGSYFTASNVLGLEHYLDNTIDLFIRVLQERFVDEGVHCDMADYFLLFAWDAMSDVTFGEPIGFLQEAGEKSLQMIKMADSDFDYFGTISQMPDLDKFLGKNPYIRLRPPPLEWAAKLGSEHYAKRKQGDKLSHGPNDLLDKYLETQKKHPELVNDNQMISYLLTNTVGGSDTTAYTLVAIIYYVLKNRAIYDTLREEIDNAHLKIPVSWKVAKQLPYLDAVIREAIRVHPAASLIMERIVPQGGLRLPDGRFVPQGIAVGMNPWVINRDEATFGQKPDRFIPERWLKRQDETKEQFEGRRKRMINTVFSFGTGPRTCLGLHLSMMEMYKAVASIFAKFDMELAYPYRQWKVTNSFVLRTENVPVILRSKS